MIKKVKKKRQMCRGFGFFCSLFIVVGELLYACFMYEWYSYLVSLALSVREFVSYSQGRNIFRPWLRWQLPFVANLGIHKGEIEGE